MNDPGAFWRRWLRGTVVLALVSFCCVVLAACSPETSTTRSADASDAVSGAGGEQWLRDVSDELGLGFTHTSGATGAFHMPEMTGPGLALLDANGDGALDLYLIDGNADPAHGRPDGTSRNRLFLQQESGDFADFTEPSGLGDGGFGMGVAVGDVDNDGRDDLYLTNYGEDRLFRNTGDAVFEDVTERSGVAAKGWSSSATFCDVDRDGWLDLYVARYVRYEPEKICQGLGGERDYCGPDSFEDQADLLLRNTGHGIFEDVSSQAGIDSVKASGLGVICADLSGDGWPDLYVANDGDPNQYWVNQGDFTFRDTGVVMGVAVNAQGRPEAGMGLVAADLDGDTDLDLFMTHLAEESNTLYRNLGPGIGFEDSTMQSGLAQPSVPYTGFGTLAFDLELDGDVDLLVVNGRVKRGPPVGGQRSHTGEADIWRSYVEPNAIFLNRGDGRFQSAGRPLAAFSLTLGLSRGAAAGDLDRDGDLDVVVMEVGSRPRVYRNEAPRTASGLLIEPYHPKWRRIALGSIVRVEIGSFSQSRLVTSTAGYLSSGDPRAHFAVPSGSSVDNVRVLWPDGTREDFLGVQPGMVRLVWGEGTDSR